MQVLEQKGTPWEEATGDFSPVGVVLFLLTERVERRNDRDRFAILHAVYEEIPSPDYFAAWNRWSALRFKDELNDDESVSYLTFIVDREANGRYRVADGTLYAPKSHSAVAKSLKENAQDVWDNLNARFNESSYARIPVMVEEEKVAEKKVIKKVVKKNNRKKIERKKVSS